MNRKSVLYSLIGLLLVSATATIGLPLVLKPQISQAQTTSAPEPAFPGMGSMMGQTDQHFIVMMIPHHEGAIAMADLALERSQRPEILALAESIKATQTQEIEQMQSWYRQWYNADVPEWTPGEGMGMMHGWNGSGPGMGMMHEWRGYRAQSSNQPSSGIPGFQRGTRQGMQGQRQPGMGCWGMDTMQGNITALQNASDFDRAFIEEMIPHHQMGVMMAQMALVHSDRPEIQALAQNIIEAQTAEINQMQQWYQQWY